LGRRGELIRIRVEEVDEAGVARGDVRVNGVLPGEEVEVRIEHVGKRGVAYGALARVIEPSPERIDPRCQRFLACGGCDFLHAPLSFQHELKRRRIAAALDVALERIEPVVSSPRELGYRALAKLVVSEGVLGSYKPRTHDVVSMDGCLVHAPEVERIADALRAIDLPPELRYVLIRGSLAEGNSVVTLVSRTLDSADLRAVSKTLSSRDDVARIVLHENDREGDALLDPKGREEILFDRGAPSERIGAVSQSLASGAFAQVNPLAAEKLYGIVSEMIAPAGKRIVDLYCGSGGIALTLASAGAAEVIGVEANEAAVRAARDSARSMRADNARFVAEDVKAFAIPDVDAVVLNPPRKGAPPEVIDRITAPIVVYVSCNPDSLSRDLARMPGRIDRIVPVDLFPQTQHVETVVRIQR
jgi:23S rRNA (uracil-5-)-methyltransferase RumA